MQAVLGAEYEEQYFPSWKQNTEQQRIILQAKVLREERAVRSPNSVPSVTSSLRILSAPTMVDPGREWGIAPSGLYETGGTSEEGLCYKLRRKSENA